MKQFFGECFASFLLLVAIVPGIGSLSRKQFRDGGLRGTAAVDLSPIHRAWVSCFLSSLFGPLFLAMNLLQSARWRSEGPLSLAWWDTLCIAQSYVLYLRLSPVPTLAADDSAGQSMLMLNSPRATPTVDECLTSEKRASVDGSQRHL